MLWAAMPEAAVHKHCDSLAAKDKIGAALNA
jgi:hypothetical protein